MPSDLVRFEDVELDAQRYSLRRSGRNLRLERIPMELLLLLVERRGLSHKQSLHLLFMLWTLQRLKDCRNHNEA